MQRVPLTKNQTGFGIDFLHYKNSFCRIWKAYLFLTIKQLETHIREIHCDLLQITENFVHELEDTDNSLTTRNERNLKMERFQEESKFFNFTDKYDMVFGQYSLIMVLIKTSDSAASKQRWKKTLGSGVT